MFLPSTPSALLARKEPQVVQTSLLEIANSPPFADLGLSRKCSSTLVLLNCGMGDLKVLSPSSWTVNLFSSESDKMSVTAAAHGRSSAATARGRPTAATAASTAAAAAANTTANNTTQMTDAAIRAQIAQCVADAMDCAASATTVVSPVIMP